jgi:hypothetical protein
MDVDRRLPILASLVDPSETDALGRAGGSAYPLGVHIAFGGSIPNYGANAPASSALFRGAPNKRFRRPLQLDGGRPIVLDLVRGTNPPF